MTGRAYARLTDASGAQTFPSMTEFADHRAFLASLPPETRARLSERRDGPGLLRMAAHFGAIGGVGALIAFRVPLWPFLLPVQGVLIVFLFTLLHEAIHGTPFRSRWLNAVAARAASLPIFLPADWFRYFHLAHHRWTQDPERDPELAETWPMTWRGYLWRVSGLPTWRSHFATLLRNARGRCDDAFVPASGRGKVKREARAMLAVYAAIGAAGAVLAPLEMLFIWLVPVLLGQPVLRLYLMAEHGRCPFVADMLANTRTTFTNRVVRWVAWNMPYHAEHHAFPAAPFHKLPALHAHARPHLKETQRGYGRFHGKLAAGLKA